MKYLLLTLLFLVSILIRTTLLDTRPIGFTWDEAALGYNAYSLLLTGKDEHSQPFPVIFKSFGDFKPGLYIYLTVPFVAALGLNELGTRLPSALIGSLMVLVMFVLTSKLTKNTTIGFYSSFVITFMPWAIHFSRGAWEANINLFLTTLAIALLLNKKLFMSALFFGLTFWSYQAAKLFTPLIILFSLIFLNQKTTLKSYLKPATIVLLLLIPILINFSGESGRLNVYSVFNYPQQGTFDSNIFHTQAFHFTKGVTERYLNHFSPRFLFTDGDWSSLRHSILYYGNLHLIEVIPLLIGLICIFKYITNKRNKLIFILIWLLLAPLPAALSRDIISGVRSLQLIVPLCLLVSIGLYKTPKLLLAIYFPSIILSSVFYFDLLVNHSPYNSGDAWLFPYKQAVQLVSKIKSDFTKVYFTDKLGQPYIFNLFYSKYDPKLYQLQNTYVQVNNDVGYVSGFDKFTFGQIYWPSLRGEKSALFIGDKFELPDQDMNPENLVWIGDINYPNGQHALRIVGLK